MSNIAHSPHFVIFKEIRLVMKLHIDESKEYLVIDECTQKAYMHLNGRGCPRCNRSKLEISVENILQNLTQQKKFEWLRYELPMSLDFYCEEKHIAIECQGEQHFYKNPTSYFDDVELVMKRDQLKYQQCKEHNIEVIYYFPEDFLKYDIDFYKDKKCFHNVESLKKYFI